jgi:HD-like signal output (HDOD) protein
MDRLIDQVDRLHSAPHVACQIVRLLHDEDYETAELVACLQSDPALASSILRLVNSSFFGLAHHVGSLQHAVTYLGSRSLRLAVLSFGLLRQLVKDTPARVYRDFWQRSLTMASVGTRLAPRLHSAADEAYSAGLLADIGLLVLAQVDTRSYVTLYERVGHSLLLIESERERYGFHHGQLGARLLERWNLPDALSEAVAEHHVLQPAPNPLVLVTHAADVLADALWTPQSPRVQEARTLLEAEFQLGLDDFITLAMECKEAIQDAARTYQVNLVAEIDCDALLEQARHQYMSAAIAAAIDWDSLAAVADHDTQDVPREP